MKRLLIVDDEPNVRLNYRITLESEGYDITETGTALDALQKLRTHPFELAILDMRMPENGWPRASGHDAPGRHWHSGRHYHGVQRRPARGLCHEAWGDRLPAKALASRGVT